MQARNFGSRSIKFREGFLQLTIAFAGTPQKIGLCQRDPAEFEFGNFQLTLCLGQCLPVLDIFMFC